MRRVLLVLVLCSCGSPKPAPPPPGPPQVATPAVSEKMATFTINGYTLTGAEYWPYVGTEDIKYPEEVLWGFYPEKGVMPEGEDAPNPASARPEAIACAKKAFDALKAFVESDPPAFKRVVSTGEKLGVMVPRFYLWTNDYGRAATPYAPGVREARLWWWARKTPAPPKPPGYWKWESVVTQSGECLIPHQPQIDQYIAEVGKKFDQALEAKQQPDLIEH